VEGLPPPIFERKRVQKAKRVQLKQEAKTDVRVYLIVGLVPSSRLIVESLTLFALPGTPAITKKATTIQKQQQRYRVGTKLCPLHPLDTKCLSIDPQVLPVARHPQGSTSLQQGARPLPPLSDDI
jgi:hypothetical protein